MHISEEIRKRETDICRYEIGRVGVMVIHGRGILKKKKNGMKKVSSFRDAFISFSYYLLKSE